ncbi:TOTE conflict system archaeo-eukaryotic primase domain-containing protein [Clostridium saccharobutylicum]|uniref:Type III restriction enzyme, res subunit n=1 Tax=Clostridium saccharobutylicum TaxID=169679 RepID=A0A1S8MSS5_CLOSA|nr:DEAD/DEAH box helicase [Clostridium saccharobutylicum]OOM07236.1 type III restriction enzyme, res subunit [Clostridium saccharobutylicum]
MSSYNELLEENKNLKFEIHKLKKEIEKLKSYISTNDNRQTIINHSININSTLKEKIKLYRSLFHGRNDVFALRWDNESKNTHGYKPYCINEWKHGICNKSEVKCSDCDFRKFKSLEDKDIVDHLSGQKTIGLYPLLSNDKCKFLAIDFDDTSWQKDVLLVVNAFSKFNISTSIERSRSGDGCHLWVFFYEEISARIARYFGNLILNYTLENNVGLDLGSYDRLFPNQDKMPKGGFGNLIALPLQRVPAKNKNSLFVNTNFEYYKDQWEYLSNVNTVTLSKINTVIELLENELKVSLPESNTNTVHNILYNRKASSKPNIIDLPSEISIVLSNGIYIDSTLLPNELLNLIKRTAVFSNPEYYTRQAMRLSVYKTPKTINGFDEYEKYLILPRGLSQEVYKIFEDNKVKVNIQDKRISGMNIDVAFNGKLYAYQQIAVEAILKYDNGVLWASTAFGKTVVAANIIVSRKVSTLIIVNSIQLLEQWEEKLKIFLEINKDNIGRLGGGKKKVSNIIDIATMQTLNKNNALDKVLNNYGQIIIDECHHVAAFTFEKIMKAVKAKYVLGLTATPNRKDKYDKIITMQCGPIVHKAVSTIINEKKVAHMLIPRSNEIQSDKDLSMLKLTELYDEIMNDKSRNELIINDIIEAFKLGSTPLILTERVEHLNILSNMLGEYVDNIIILKGGMRNKQRKSALNIIKSFSKEEHFIILATGKYIGEGFDESRLDTLFLTMPISWKGVLQQYAGRLQRMYEGKNIVKIYDYVDNNVPMLVKMYNKRLKGYKNLDYNIEENTGIQYEFDNI